jgi:hypothetical protein
MLWDLLQVDFIGLLVMNFDLKEVLLVHLCDYRDEIVHHDRDKE